ncbi:MAG: TM0106 family RecB-like putative nuclease [Acidobacteria bacterium]|nr:TM0106 family RecB-like putative nuclease [Acidobacteriota bacterium]
MHRNGQILVLSPSDLTAFLACPHRSHLDRLVVEGILDRPERDDPELEILRRHGDRHERRELERLRAEGRSVIEIDCPGSSPEALAAAEANTLAAMQAGADVVFQATFFDGRWRGHADFLIKVDSPSDLGPWSYEVADTKLARRAKPAAIIQLCCYAEQVARLQGRWPDEVEVVTGDGERHRHRVADAVDYYRHAKARFEAAVAEAAEVGASYPEPVDHCSVCPWLERCDATWRADDHLSLVAGLRPDMTVKLGRAGVHTLTELASSSVGQVVAGMGLPTADRLRHQARLQLAQRSDGRIRYELLPPEEGRGLVSLPPPSKGDLFFDMEGDPWAIDGLGIEYLWGVTEADGTYHAFWAHEPAAEKRAFEDTVDLFLDRLAIDPEMHVYHYAAYEVSALKRLAGRYATREAEVDRLLRCDVLVDLYRVVRQGVRVSQEGYGLKKLEPLYLAARSGAITDGGSSIVAYEQWLEEGADDLLEAIRAYNELDCVSTQGLRDWLEQRRSELPEPAPRAEPPDADPSESIVEEDARTEALVAAIGDRVPLLGALVGWHRRESRPDWWVWFDRMDRTDEELVNDAECIGDLAYIGVVGEVGKSLVHRYGYEATQEHKFSVGDRPADPRTGNGAGEIVALDAASGTVDLKRGKTSNAPHPRSLVPPKPYDNKVLREAVARLAQRVVDHPGTNPPRHGAVLDLLHGLPPSIKGLDPGAPLALPGESGAEALLRLAPLLERGCLPVQGPPGSGKTWTGAAVVVDAVRRGKRVGVTAQSHKAIGNLLDAIVRRAAAEGAPVRVWQKASADNACAAEGVWCTDSNDEVDEGLATGRIDVIGGTAWLFARKDLDEKLDLLVVDEAGQLSLANILAVSGSARDLVLLGDPQQLAQVSRGAHPPGAGVSALEHVLEEAATIPPERGVLLEHSHRMHPEICRFVSDLSYDGRLVPEPSCATQAIGDGPVLAGAGLRWVPVGHRGNRTRSDEEAAAVAGLVAGLVGRSWTDRSGQQRWLTLEDVLVIAPYNAQVAALAEVLPDGARIGTVDRFQGQEAPVAIYSLAASSADDVPRGLDFLLSRNRLNVALSRAQAMTVVVGSPALLDAPCHTVGQLSAVNALCRYVDRAWGERSAG